LNFSALLFAISWSPAQDFNCNELTLGTPTARVVSVDHAFDIGVFGIGSDFLIQDLKVLKVNCLHLCPQFCSADLKELACVVWTPFAAIIINYTKMKVNQTTPIDATQRPFLA
jgi:hypothetical protein